MSTIFMNIKGMKGNVSAKGYQDWIALDGMAFNSTRRISSNVGNCSDRGGSLPQFSQVELIKRLDNSSNDLFSQFCIGKSSSEVEVHVCSTASDLTPYMKYVFSDVIFSEHTTDISADVIPMETIQFTYTKIQRSYTPRAANNKLTAPNTIGYDLERAQQL
jgi:type VI secretion system secreted protein Hcp